MYLTAMWPTDVLWRSALVAVPVVILAAIFCRLFPCQPATRHKLWLIALAMFVVPPLLPRRPSLGLDTLVQSAVSSPTTKATETIQEKEHTITEYPVSTSELIFGKSARANPGKPGSVLLDTSPRSDRNEVIYQELQGNEHRQNLLNVVDVDIDIEHDVDHDTRDIHVDIKQALVATRWTPKPQNISLDINVLNLDRLVYAAQNSATCAVPYEKVRRSDRLQSLRKERSARTESRLTERLARAPGSVERLSSHSIRSRRSSPGGGVCDTGGKKCKNPSQGRECVVAPRGLKPAARDLLLPYGCGSDWRADCPPYSPRRCVPGSDLTTFAMSEKLSDERSLSNEKLSNGQGSQKSDPKEEMIVGAWAQWFATLVAVGSSLAKIPAIPPTLWIAGSFVLVFFGVIQILRFRRILARGTAPPEDVVRAVRRAAEKVGLRRVPEILMVNAAISPMIWCGQKARLLIPQTLWSELDDVGRRAVIFHELAHLRRRDHWICWAENLIGCLYWWHPLVWWIRKRLQDEADLCCDAWVTWLMPRGRRAYAEAILRATQYTSEQSRAVLVVGMGVTNGRAKRFARRLTMVMTQSNRPGLSMPGIVLMAVLATTGWLTTPAQSCPDDQKNAEKEIKPTFRAVTVPSVPTTPTPPAVRTTPTPPLPNGPLTGPMGPTTLEPMVYTAPMPPIPLLRAIPGTAIAPALAIASLPPHFGMMVLEPSMVGVHDAPPAVAVGRVGANCDPPRGPRFKARGESAGKGPSSDCPGLCEKCKHGKECKGKLCKPCKRCAECRGCDQCAKRDSDRRSQRVRVEYRGPDADGHHVLAELHVELDRMRAELERCAREWEGKLHENPKRWKEQAPKIHERLEFAHHQYERALEALQEARNRIEQHRYQDQARQYDQNQHRYRKVERRVERELRESTRKADREARQGQQEGTFGFHHDAPRPPRPPRSPRPPRARSAPAPNDREMIVRTYHLPEGKLKALTGLMSRPDVPVLIGPLDDGIEVHGDRRQQRIFAAFVNMIHPEGAVRSDDDDHAWDPDWDGDWNDDEDEDDDEDNDALKLTVADVPKLLEGVEVAALAVEPATEQALAALGHLDEIEIPEAEVVTEQIEEEIEEAIEEAMEGVETAVEAWEDSDVWEQSAEIPTHLNSRHAEEWFGAARSALESASRALEAQADRIERQARSLEDQMNALQAEAKALEERTEGLEDEEEHLRYEAKEAPNHLKAELLNRVGAIQKEAINILSQVGTVESNAELIEARAELFREIAEELREAAEELAEEAHGVAGNRDAE